jgi:hypothetical protein
MSEIAAAKTQAKIFIPASLVDPIFNRQQEEPVPARGVLATAMSGTFRDCNAPARPAANLPCCHCQGLQAVGPKTMLSNILESISAFTPPDCWLATGSYGGGDLLLVLLGSIDRLCGQFAIALQNAEHEHFFLLAALIGTLTLVFPTHL